MLYLLGGLKRGEGLAAASLTEDDMTLIQEVKLMSPLKVATTLLREEKVPTLSMIAPIQAKLHKHFSNEDSNLPVITEMKQWFREDFSGRYLQLKDLLHSAAALDPRCKDLAFLNDVDIRDLIFMKITTEVLKMNEKAGDSGTLNEGEAAEGGDNSPNTEEERDDASPKKKTALHQLFGEFLTTRAPLKTIREKAKDEILKYRERDSLHLTGDVLQWWKKQVDLPLLSALAKSYLSIPATSVSSERV
ncbi:hypothetical protein ACEWY4_007543 [Coilia grayii]|uniref:HAT C-terminal dimerisation domain-containing protein n=1 Tax=Coilia grayii TaxID=363190 RepID=A0ABD1KGJ0_9TELE